MTGRIVSYMTLTGVFLSLLVSGCGPKAEIALKFTPDDVTTYKLTTLIRKGYRFDQPSINKFKNEKTASRLEMVFTQNIKDIDSSGNATAEINIKQLMYRSQNPKGEGIYFDSTRAKDKTKPISALIGRSYTIRIATNGDVEVLDAGDVRGLLTGSSEEKFAEGFLSDEAIEKRHAVPALSTASRSETQVGDNWTLIKNSPSGMLRPKTYEKIYTLKEILTEGDQEVAVIEMEAITTGRADDHEAPESAFAKMFDSSDIYKGQLLLNLTTGKIEKYTEKLEAVWVASEDEKIRKSDKGPDVLTMSFNYLYTIEKN